MIRSKGIANLISVVVSSLLLVLAIGVLKPSTLGMAPGDTCGDTITSDLTMSHNLGACLGTGLTIDNDSVTLDCAGYTISGVDATQTGILVKKNNVTIKNCIVRDFSLNIANYDNPIYTQFQMENLTLINNTVISGIAGIGIYGDSGGTNPTKYNILINNSASNNTWLGFYIVRSKSCVILNNSGTNNTQDGIALQYSNNNTLVNNSFTKNLHSGIGLFTAAYNNFSDNNIADNVQYGIYMQDLPYGNLFWNNLVNNTNNVYGSNADNWNITKTLGTNIVGGPYIGGNYWSNYAGSDTDDDGIGNTNLPYNNGGGISSFGDYLPLIISAPPGTSLPHIVNSTSPACTDGEAYYNTVSAAVAAASPGDTIIVCPGTYSDNVDINKPLNISSYSQNPADTIINKASGSMVISITGANYVNISGFKIVGNNGISQHGIYMTSSNFSNISNIVLFDNNGGIRLDYSSNNTFTNINIPNSEGVGAGILVYYNSNNNTFKDITIHVGDRGIFLRYDSSFNIVDNLTAETDTCGIELWDNANNNTITNSRANTGGWGGIAVGGNSNYNIFVNNTANGHTDVGIYISSDSNNNLTGNRACSNTNNDIFVGSSGSSGDNICDVYNMDGSTVTCLHNCSWTPPSGPSCGDTITSDTTLTTDIGPCSGNGLNIGLNNIVLDCNGQTITGSRSNNGIYVNNHNNVTIKNCNVQNYTEGIRLNYSSSNNLTNNTVYKNFNGIVIMAANNSILTNNIIYNSNNYGIYIDSSYNNSFDRNTVYGNNQGISFFSANKNNTLNNNTIYSNTNDGITLSVNSGNNTLLNNNVSFNSKGINLQSANNTLINNTANSNRDTGIVVQSGHNSVLINNTAWNNTASGIYLWSSTNNTLTSNTVNNNYYGIRLNSANLANITNSTALNNKGIGIFIVSSSNNNLLNNTVNNNNDTGIRLFSGSGNTFMNNTFWNNTNYGIYITNSSKNILTSNTFGLSSKGAFISISNNNTFSSNTFNNNTKGMHIIRSSYNNFSNSIVHDNSQEGILIEGSGYPAPAEICNNGIDDDYNGLVDCSDPACAAYPGCGGTSFNTIVNGDIVRNNIGISIVGEDNCVIANNTVNSNVYGIFLNKSISNNITNNTAFNNTFGIYIYFSSNNTLINNTARNNTNYGIELASSNNNTITNNMAANSSYGIVLTSNCNNNTLTSNTASGTNGGIWLTGGSNNNLTNNTATNNIDGIFLSMSSGNNVTSNNVTNNYHGITISYALASNNIVANNTIYNNTLYGIMFDTSNHDVIANNNISLSTYGISFTTSSNNIISNNTVYNNTNGIYLDTSSNNTLTSNTAFNNTYLGIYLTSSSNNDITDNMAFSNRGGIRLDYGSNNTIKNNTIYNVHNILDSSINLYQSHNNTISNNTAYNDQYGTILSYSNNNTITNNNFYNHTFYGIYLGYSSNNTLINNTAYNNTQYGIYLDASSNNTLTNNTLNNNTRDGLWLASSSNNTLTNNTLNNNGLYGIYLSNSPNNTLTENTVDKSEQDSIRITGSSNNALINNTICNSIGGPGISIVSSSDYTILTGNTACSNAQSGIYLFQSSNNILTNNTAYNNNEYGINLAESDSNNTIINNTAFNNTRGISFRQYSSNNNIINSTFNNNTYGIYLDSSSKYEVINNVFTNDIARDNTNWDFYSKINSRNNTAYNLMLSTANVSFTGKDFAINASVAPPTAPHNISRFFNATNTSTTGWAMINVSYTEPLLGGIDENTLKLYRYSGSWQLLAQTGVNNVSNYVWGNATQFSTFAPLGTSAPTWSNNQSTIPSSYTPAPIEFDIDWVSDADVSTVLFESNFSGSPQNYTMTNDTHGSPTYDFSAIISAGTFYWKSWANDTSNNWGVSDMWYFTIEPAANLLEIQILPSASVDYRITTVAICSATDGTPTLYRNDSATVNQTNETIRLGAGIYNYTCNITGSQNYTASSTTRLLTVNPVVNIVGLLLNGRQDQNLRILSGMIGNATGVSLAGTAYLWRDGAHVSNPEIATLPVGLYSYKVNATGDGQNYTDNDAGLTYTLNISLPECNDTITIDTTIANDILSCSSNGLNIGADSITLDCAGHSITGQNANYGIAAYNRKNITVKNCNISHFASGIYIQNSSRSNVTNNTANNNIAPGGSGNGIQLYNSSLNSVSYNILASNGILGIWVNASSNNTIFNNTANNNVNGIALYPSSSFNTLTNNTAINSTNFGIILSTNSNNNTVISSMATNSGVTGIYVFSVANNTISTSQIDFNHRYGVDMISSSSYNTLTNNTISNNRFDGNSRGIHIDSSSNNNINYNRVYNNSGNIESNAMSNNITLNYWGGFLCIWVTGPPRSLAKPYYFDYAMTMLRSTEFCCGDTVTSNYVLFGDLICQSSGYTIGADNIVLDCAGRSITGPGSSNPSYSAISATGRTNLTIKNCLMTNYFLGISLVSSSNNFITNNTGSNEVVPIFLQSGSNNNVLANNAANSNTVGMVLFSSGYNTFVNSTANNSQYNPGMGVGGQGIWLQSSSHNTFISPNITNSGIWDFYSTTGSLNNTVINLTTQHNVFSFNSKDVSVIDGTAPASDPSGYQNISKYVNATSNSADSWLFLNVSYAIGDLGGLNKNSLFMARRNSTGWETNTSNFAAIYGVNNVSDYVWANITSFGSIFAPLGKPVSCGDGTCEGGETCSSCPADCGSCPAPPAPPSTGGGETGLIQPPFDPTERVTALIVTDGTGEFIVPAEGATLLLEGQPLESAGPPPSGSSYLVLEAAGTARINKLEKIDDPTKLASLPDLLIPLNSWEIETDATKGYFCRDFSDVPNIDAASVTVYVFDGKEWMQLPSDRVILNLPRKTVCGQITSTPYLIAGFTTAIAFPAPAPLPCEPCPEPGVYGACTEGRQSRLSYSCASATNYTCQKITESRFCVSPEVFPLVQIVIGVIVFFFVVGMLGWVRLQQKVRPEIRKRKHKKGRAVKKRKKA